MEEAEEQTLETTVGVDDFAFVAVVDYYNYYYYSGRSVDCDFDDDFDFDVDADDDSVPSSKF